MKMEHRKTLRAAVCYLAGFLSWTAAVASVDIQAVGPQGSAVGFAAWNRFFHDLTGTHMNLYTLTDWLSLIPAVFVLGFGIAGLVQWIRRKALLQVDRSILLLGGFYGVVLGVYGLFETIVVNYRPVLMGGILEPSYPSSTTVLVICVMETAIIQLRTRIPNTAVLKRGTILIRAFTLFMVAARLLSGVHWFTDIVGGILLSMGLVKFYDFAVHIQDP